MKNYISSRAGSVDASGIRKIWQLAASMKDPVNFSIGEPDFATPEPVKQAAIAAISQNLNTYTVTAGLPKLKEALNARIRDEFHWPNPSILITSGLSGALSLAIWATIDPGDEVLITDPAFVSYRHLVNLSGGKPVWVDTYPEFDLDAEKIRAAITPKTKIMFINSPANPTGKVFSEKQLKAAAEVLKAHNILVFSDEIYREFSFDEPAASIADYYDNTVVMRGFSKTYGVPGWRLGYVAAPEHLAGVVDKMTTLQQYTFVCAPHPFQMAAISALNCDISNHIADYRKKRDLIFNGLKGDFKLIQPGGAFYAFVEAPGGNATEFVTEAIKNDVLIIPGNVFSSRDSHFRISYATRDDMIQKGVERLCRLARRGW
jgi:aspartate aminotransferase